MNSLLSLLSVNNIWFTVLGYPMSGVEFLGTIFNLWCVWLVAKNKVLNWPVGLVGTVLFAALFYQIQLYSDFFEQIYFLITGVMGWWMWTRGGSKASDESEGVKRIAKGEVFNYLVSIVVGTLLLSKGMSSLNTWWPAIFPVAASYPFLDAFTSVMSFVATWLLVKRKLENWYLWIVVDVIGVWLYYSKGVVFVAALYFIFLILATKGLLNWKKLYDKQNKEV